MGIEWELHRGTVTTATRQNKTKTDINKKDKWDNKTVLNLNTHKGKIILKKRETKSFVKENIGTGWTQRNKVMLKDQVLLQRRTCYGHAATNMLLRSCLPALERASHGRKERAIEGKNREKRENIRGRNIRPLYTSYTYMQVCSWVMMMSPVKLTPSPHTITLGWLPVFCALS